MNSRGRVIVLRSGFITSIRLRPVSVGCGFLGAFRDDATVFMPLASSPSRLAGKSRIRNAFAPLLEEVTKSGKEPPFAVLAPRDAQVQNLDDVAVVSLHLGRTLDPAGAEAVSFSRRNSVLRRARDSWVVVRLHASNVLTPPAS